MFDFSKLVGFYRQDLEDRDFLSATQTDARYLSFGDLPERIDPRNHPLGQEGWLQVEDQLQIGSCFKVGSLVKLSNGKEKPIEQLTKQDKVISHTGKERSVNYLFRNTYTGYMYTFELESYGRKITVTSNHNFLDLVDGEFKKKKAEDFNESDLMYLNTKSSTYEKSYIDLADYLTEDLEDVTVTMEYVRYGKRSKKIKRYIPLDKKLGWLLGFYCAEGYVTKSNKNPSLRINFATNANEKEFHSKIHNYFRDVFGLELAVKKDSRPNNYYQYCHSKTLGYILEKMCGKGAYNKRVPLEIFSASKECKLAFVKGWLAGDGSEQHFYKNKVKFSSIGYSTSHDLVSGIYSISLDLGLSPTFSNQKEREGNRKSQSILNFKKEDFSEVANYKIPKEYYEWLDNKPKLTGAALQVKEKASKNKVSESLISCKIKSITKEYVVDETVYNLEVDVDHTVIVNGIAAFQCQGQALTENIEYCYTVATGKVLQFSRMFAYLESQRFDNIRSDSGSTLSGGTKAVKQTGICREEIAPYPNRYPGHSWMTQIMRDDASKYKLLSHTEMSSVEQIKSFLGSGIGVVQIGISWNNSMNPSSNGTITSFSGGGGGGHSVSICGYLPDSDINVKSSAGYWLILKNSWGTRWGVRGYCYVDPKAVEQMLRHQFTVMIGRSEMVHPEPRPVPVDFTKPGQSMYA
jgi:hypothetical protein